MHTYSAILACHASAPLPARALLGPVRPRTSLPLLAKAGWAGAPLAEPRLRGQPDGGRVAACAGYAGVDTGRVKALLERSFGKILIAGYFELPAHKVLICGDYSGVAIIKKLAGIDYLDKLAVEPSAQGAGVGGRLWESIRGECGSLIWRASAENPANGWYLRSSDGAARAGKWIVYWYGMDAGTASGLVPLAASLPSTMI